MMWKKNVLAKKLWRYSIDFCRPVLAPFMFGNIVLANSFPKSGTHLLTQILEPLGQVDFGNFISSTPSFTMKEKSLNSHVKAVRNLLQNEITPGHIFFSDVINRELLSRNVVHYFIYRNPRDIVVSEANYLANMNRWHKLHPFLKGLNNSSDRYDLVINGIDTNDFYWPDIGKRMARYNSWLSLDNVCSVRYEDLMGENRNTELFRIVEFYKSRTGGDFNIDEMVAKCSQAINPSRSHTFHKGVNSDWRNHLSESNLDLFYSVAGEMCNDWGY